MNTPAASLFENVIAVIRQQVLAEVQQTTSPAQTGSPKRLLTVREAADYLGRTEQAMRQLIHKKLVPVIRFGRNVRLDIRDLDAIIADCRM